MDPVQTDFSPQTDFFTLADRRLAWLGKRQEILAQNIANADTPGWQSRDLPPFSEMLAKTVEPFRTDPLHLAGDDAGGGVTFGTEERVPDGNGVSVEDELMKVADTQTSQELVTNLYKTYLGLFRTALGR